MTEPIQVDEVLLIDDPVDQVQLHLRDIADRDPALYHVLAGMNAKLDRVLEIADQVMEAGKELQSSPILGGMMRMFGGRSS